MPRSPRAVAGTIRLLTAAVTGAVLGAAAFSIAYARHPQITLEMDRPVDAVARGFYAEERAGDETFAWTGRTASVDLPGLDRRSAWTCDVRVRAGRGAPLVLPALATAVDGLATGTTAVTNDYADVRIPLPARPDRPGARIDLGVSDPFTPGGGDTRELGVIVDRLACAPDAGAKVRPPAGTMGRAALAGGILGAALVLAGLGPLATLAVLVVATVAQAIPLAAGLGPFSSLPGTAVRLALGAGSALVVGIRATDLLRGTPITTAARLASAVAAAAGYLELVALLHPAKPVIDAVFQAHRLQWILDGRFYFTQPMPNGVQFPYAIALYVFAAPWTLLTSDYVALLRVVVIGAGAAASIGLYAAVARDWQDRAAGVVAVALAHLVPLTYVVIGNANLPNAFGQSVALVAIVCAATCDVGDRAWRGRLLLFGIATVAMLSHVSTIALLASTLAATGALFWMAGGSAAGGGAAGGGSAGGASAGGERAMTTGRAALRASGRGVLIATAAAVVASVVVYYGHFPEVYERLDRLRGTVTEGPAGERSAGPVADAPSRPVTGAPDTPASPLGTRLMDGGAAIAAAFGWPMILLALAGLWTLRFRPPDRLTLAIAGLGLASVAFFLVGVVPRIEGSFERYALEFVGRVALAAIPGVVILAARGTTFLWGTGLAGRAGASVLLLWTMADGAGAWLAWLD
ncbi:MAG: hypothetical protein R2752_11485 [Vicinamibacterales bacterium]